MGTHNNQKKSFLASTTITLLIVAMLLFSGPAQAVSVMILGLQDKYTQGGSVKFQVQIDINDPDQFIPISDVTVNLTGTDARSRVFTLDGIPISGDSIITIEKVRGPSSIDYGTGIGYGYGYGYGYDFGYGSFGYADYGYGYPNFGYGSGYGYMAGYGYGSGYGGLTFIYNVTIDTSNLPVGDYNIVANLNTGNPNNPKFISGSKHFTLTPQPTPQPPGPPSASGGGPSTGGGGVITSEPLENIIKHETRDCSLVSGKPSSCRFTVPEHWVSELLITGEVNEVASFRIEALKGQSPKVPVAAPGTKYLNIWPGSKRIQETLIRFSVDNSWISSEGLTAENLRMYNWDGSKWNEIETTLLSKDSSVTNYEARTKALSYFAISGIKGAAVPATPPGAKPALTATTKVTGTPPGMEAVPGTSMNLYLIIIVFIVILAGGALYFARKK